MSCADLIAWQGVWIMMTSSNGNIFRVTGPLCVCVCVGGVGGGGGGGGGGGVGGGGGGVHRSPVDFPHKGQWRGALMFSLTCAWDNEWANNRNAGDLKRQCACYDVTVMSSTSKGFRVTCPKYWLVFELKCYWYLFIWLHRRSQHWFV